MKEAGSFFEEVCPHCGYELGKKTTTIVREFLLTNTPNYDIVEECEKIAEQFTLFNAHEQTAKTKSHYDELIEKRSFEDPQFKARLTQDFYDRFSGTSENISLGRMYEMLVADSLNW